MIGAPRTLALEAASLPTPLAHFSDGAATGAVIATFERSAYLDIGGRIVALASADLSRGPLVITLAQSGALPELPAGAPVSLYGGVLRVGSVTVDLRGAAPWDPHVPRAALGAGAAHVRDVVQGELLAGAPAESIAPLLSSRPDAGRDTPLLTALARGLTIIAEVLDGARPANALDSAAQEIAGRGPGLTPSGDDLILGIVLALEVWPDITSACGPGLRAATVQDLLVSAAIPRTTRISAAYLEAARRGQAMDVWHAFIRALDGGRDALRAAVRRMLRIGETSGADALTGFCWAWRRRPA